MKHITDYILEGELKYELPNDYVERTKSIMSELVASLPRVSTSKFYFNEYDIASDKKMESPEFIGYPERIHVYINTDKTDKRSDFNADTMKDAFKNVFDATIKEGVFDNNITTELPEYSWVCKLYDALANFFKTKSLNGINLELKTSKYLPASTFKKLKNKPTIEKNGLFVSLYAIDLSNIEPDNRYSSIDIIIIVYEKKDLKKVAAIKNYNDNLKPLDVIGRELMIGDTVAYSNAEGYTKYSRLDVGVITSISKDQVTIETKQKQSDQCCLISRKNGKRIE